VKEQIIVPIMPKENPQTRSCLLLEAMRWHNGIGEARNVVVLLIEELKPDHMDISLFLPISWRQLHNNWPPFKSTIESVAPLNSISFFRNIAGVSGHVVEVGIKRIG